MLGTVQRIWKVAGYRFSDGDGGATKWSAEAVVSIDDIVKNVDGIAGTKMGFLKQKDINVMVCQEINCFVELFRDTIGIAWNVVQGGKE